LVPVAAMVTAHASPNNDDAAIGLDPTVLEQPNNPTRLDLPCGSYYLTKINPSNPVTIWAHGHTALYIGQNVGSSADLSFGGDPTGSLDVFIGGNLSTSAKLTVGTPNYPALTRTYIAGTGGLGLSASTSVGGNLYAAFGPVSWSADTDAFGSVF